MGVALDPAYNWSAWPESGLPSETPAAIVEIPEGDVAPIQVPCATSHYAAWQLTPERQRHEWKRARRAIISTRIRLLVCGHAVYFAGCVALNFLSSAHVCSNFASAGCYSLLMTSVVMLICEWLHVRFQPRLPPRFVVRPHGVTEYGDEGPLNHWDWSRVRQLRLVADRDHPQFRSLVVVTSGWRWLEKFHRIRIPLPDAAGEHEAIGAIGVALAENGFQWRAQVNRNELRIRKNVE